MNILVLTNIYPYEEDKSFDITKVVAFFTREWVKQGHNVVTIVNSTRFPKIYYTVAKYAKKMVVSFFDIVEAPNSLWTKKFEYDDMGVKVYNMPMFKLIPKTRFLERTFTKQIKDIKEKLAQIGFTPDVITGHWANPQARLVAELADYYNVKSALVLHDDYKKELCEKYNVNDYREKIGRFGFRCRFAEETAAGHLNFIREPFICYSGVPEQYILNSMKIDEKNFNAKKLTLITAARLLELKNIDSVIDAVHALKDVDFEYTVVGEGPMMESLKARADSYGLSKKINFTGRIDREEVQKKMAASEVYVMISSNEAFGLVYIEAMLKGCIVIASRNGGIDGVVIDGENGFLCEEGNAEELAQILKRIISLSSEEKKRIVENAIHTAKQFSDSDVAKRYLDDITQ